MNCDNAKILISAASDGELSPSEELALDRHLSACQACAREKLSIAALRETMAVWTDEEPSSLMAQNFSAKLRAIQAAKAPSIIVHRPRWQFKMAAAGLAAAVVGIALLLHSQIRPNTTVVATVEPQHHSTAESHAPTVSVNRPSAPRVAAIVQIHTPSRVAHARRVHREYVPQPKPVQVASVPTVAADSQPVGAIMMDKMDGVQSMPPARAAENSRFAPMMAKSVNADQMSEPTPDDAQTVVTKILVAQATQTQAESSVADNLGQAGLTINESIERVRGTLQRAADLIAAHSKENTRSFGGNTL